MTCIVGLIDKENDRVIIGGDSAGVTGLSVSIRIDPKVFQVGEFVIGGTTSFRMLQILRFSFIPPDYKKNYIGYQTHDENFDIYRYMCTSFVDALRECMKKGGFLTTQNGVESGGDFIVGYKNRLFSVGNDFQVMELNDGFYSVGCGEKYALGALKSLSTEAQNLQAKDIVLKALEVASYFSGGVEPPFVLLTTKGEI